MENEINTSQAILDQYGITEYTVDDIIKDFNTAKAYKEEQARIFRILDAADHSDIWKTFNRKIPYYVQTPTHNPITIIKEATKASIMPTSYAGDFRPLSRDAVQLADSANRFFQKKWNDSEMDSTNNDAAEYAFLHGTSGVLFGWNHDIVDPSDSSGYFSLAHRAQIQAKAWHPSNIFPDPAANDVEEMRFLFFAERKPKAYLKTIARFSKALAMIDNANDTLGNVDTNYILDKDKQSDREVITFLICYRRVMRVKQNPTTMLEEMTPSVDIIYMSGRNILDVAKDIKPNCIPFVPLYDERVPNNFWGISKCYKVLSLVLALNQLDSTEATSYYKNQNPCEFVSTASGLDIPAYQNKRGNPDAAFQVHGDPNNVQAFAKQPELPKDLNNFRLYLQSAIQQVSGVDAAYLGSSYGSIQTTGGVQQAQERATMRDSSRIKAIDKFIRKELLLMTQFYIMNGGEETFYVQQENDNQMPGKDVTFDPVSLIGRDDIEIVVSNCSPRSNASYEDAAMKLLELQMKYIPSEHGYPDFITPEEMIGWLNIPKAQQNVLIDRMRTQMENMKIEEYTAVLTAIGTLTQGGMPVEQALQEVVAQMENANAGQLPAARPGNIK